LRNNDVLTAALTAVTASVVGVILNLAIWFGMHVVFDEVRMVTAFGLNLDVPVWGSLNLAAAGLLLAAIVAVFRLRLGTLTVLLGSAVAGLALGALEIV
jgi:chromate transporter